MLHALGNICMTTHIISPYYSVFIMIMLGGFVFFPISQVYLRSELEIHLEIF